MRAGLNQYIENTIIERHNQMDENEDMSMVKLKHNNDLWRQLLNNKLPMDIMCILSVEMEHRINDLRNVKEVLLNKHEDISDGLGDIVDNIKVERHDKVSQMIENWADGNDEKFKQIENGINDNNERWRNEMMARVSCTLFFILSRDRLKHC